MKTRDLKIFTAMLGVAPPAERAASDMEYAVRNWFHLHPALAKLQADQKGLDVCRQFMHLELSREGGPRRHIMDRLYKRYSNLRREIETAAMEKLLPEADDRVAA